MNFLAAVLLVAGLQAVHIDTPKVHTTLYVPAGIAQRDAGEHQRHKFTFALCPDEATACIPQRPLVGFHAAQWVCEQWDHLGGSGCLIQKWYCPCYTYWGWRITEWRWVKDPYLDMQPNDSGGSVSGGLPRHGIGH